MKFLAQLLLMLLTLVSCGKDGPQKLAVDKGNIYHQFKANPSCSKVDFTQNYLEQKNLLYFFECLSWSDSYPILFRKIQDYDKTKWDALFQKLNSGIFSQEHISKFLDYLMLQKAQGKIASLQKSITDISDIDNIEKLISDFVIFLNTHPEYKEKKLLQASEFEGVFDFIKNISNGLNTTKFKLKEKANFSQSLFEKNLIALIDQIALSYMETPFISLEKLSKFFIGVEDNWIRKRFLNQQAYKTKYVLDFAYNNLGRTKKLITGVGPLIRTEEMKCYEGDSLFRLNHNAEISSRLLDATKLQYSSFMLSLLDLGQKFTFLKEICRHDESFEADMSIIENSLNYLFDFVHDETSFHFFKHLQYATTNGDELNIIGLTDFLVSPDMDLLTKFLYRHLVQDEEYFEFMFHGLQSMPKDTFKSFGQVIKSMVDKKSHAIKLLANFWQGLSWESKKAFVEVLEAPILSSEIDSTAFLDLVGFLLENYSGTINDSFIEWGNIFEKTSDLNLLFDFFTEKEVFSELKLLIKNNGVLKLVDLLTGKKVKEKVKPIEIKIIKDTKQPQYEEASSKCLSEILDLNLKGYHYGDIVGMMPLSCHEDKESFISKIFQVSSLFKKKIADGEYFDAFEKGIFSSSFLKMHAALFLSEAVKVEFDERVSLKDQVLHATDTLENLFNTLNEFKLLKPIVSSAVESFTRQDIESFFSVDKNKKKCKDDKKIGGISCENKKIFAKNIHKLVSHLLAENGGKTLFESFMRAFDPEVGVIIPYERSGQRIHVLSLENIIEFLYDQSEKERNLEVYYFEENNKKPQIYSLNILERLEIVIREIAFSHNYYGAYFVNEVSRAKNYQRKTKRLRLSLKAMAKAMPFFIRMNYVEQDDRRHLVNITNNYSALYELDYIVPKYSKGSYADLIQSVLSLLVESSAKDVQTLGMMNRPNPEVEKKHNIGFITAIVNMSGFSKLARFIRDYISPNKEDIFESSKAKKIMEWLNKELSTNENIEYLKDILTRLSIKDYEALWGLIDYLENKDIDFKTSLSKTVGNLLYLMANNELPLKEIFRMVSFFEIKNLTEVNIEIPTPFLEILSDILLRLSEGHKKELVSFWKTEHLHSLLTKTNNLTANSFSVRLANKKALQNILLNYQDAIIKNGLTQEDYFYRLFDLLLEEDQEKVSLLHNMLEILFDENGEQLQDFLEDIFQKLTISL